MRIVLARGRFSVCKVGDHSLCQPYMSKIWMNTSFNRMEHWLSLLNRALQTALHSRGSPQKRHMAAQLSFIRYPGRSGRELPAMNATGTGFVRTTVIGARPSLAGSVAA